MLRFLVTDQLSAAEPVPGAVQPLLRGSVLFPTSPLLMLLLPFDLYPLLLILKKDSIFHRAQVLRA